MCRIAQYPAGEGTLILWRNMQADSPMKLSLIFIASSVNYLYAL